MGKMTEYIKGQKIGELTFIRRYELSEKGRPKAYFLCECGEEFITRIDGVKNGRAKSCGCKTNEFRIAATGIKKIPVLSQVLLNRFLSKIKNTGNINDCWEWQAGTAVGYGHFSIGRKEYIATRIAYNLYYKKDPL